MFDEDEIPGLIIGTALTDEREAPREAPRKLDAAARAKNRFKHVKYMLGQFGYGPEKYVSMLRAQGGVCDLCGEPPFDPEPLFIDHAHQGGPNGRLRGLIHNRCNRLLGVAGPSGDSIEVLEKAIAYLRRHNARLHG